ncbi:hypothetical protein [Roseinatronobacter sp. S2]|uniref:hypothetical protein n=1 Tax=Roseinatronobacter sp. S2 TaxID=3035471 RepID=UPI00240F164D|nr:hypothetical protein [Roseinatronobacter sp. S2]WFE74261.1 hypothetical protein P8S53_13875 [Roseinatronobacter sp. S2]
MARNTTSKGTSSRTRKPKPASDDLTPQATDATAAPDPKAKATPDAGAQSKPASGRAKPDGAAPAKPDDSAAPAQSKPVEGALADAPPPTDGAPDATTDTSETQALPENAAAPVTDDADTKVQPGGTDVQPDDAAPPPAGHEAPVAATATTPDAAPVRQAGAGIGFFPFLLGGIVAGAIGYTMHFFTADQGVDQAEFAALQADLAALRQDMPTAPDLAPLEAELADLREDIAALDRPDVAAGDFSSLEGRVDALTDTLRDAQNQMEADLAQMQAELADLRDLAENRVATAEDAVDAALARSGLDSLRAALQTGQPFADATDRIAQAGFDVPDVLRDNAATGIATLEQLQDRFPDVARAAIRESLGAAPVDSAGERVVNFLRAQTGARSTVARQGDDPDAIMSRAAVAVDAGDLDAALSLLDELPDAGRAAVSDWHSAATARVQAVEQTDVLSQMITKE